jgi:hypothetical protein
MKKFIYTLSILISTLGITNAQFDLGNFYGGADIGFASPVGEIGDYIAGGFTYSASIGYRINDQISVGGEYTSTIAAGIDTSGTSGFLGVSLYGFNQYLATGHYKFLPGRVSPFVGLGLGLARTQEPTFIDSDGMEVQASRFGFGAKAEVGISIYNFVAKYAFNLNGRTPKETFFNTASADLAVNYHRFSLGYLYNF